MIVPVILAGGEGKRLYPLSTPERPKQFLRLGGTESLLARTIRRFAEPAGESESSGIAPCRRMIVTCSHRHCALLGEELSRFPDIDFDVLYEPCRRNTAAAVASAALHMRKALPESICVIAPADHAIEDQAAFRRSLAEAEAIASRGHIVLFGIEPDHPSSEYGYILAGPSDSVEREILDFVEKPEPEKAEILFESGDAFWNGGIFAASPETLLREFESCAPDILASCRAAYASGVERDGDASVGGLLLDEGFFSECRKLPFDVAVLEKTEKARMLPARFGWSDLGAPKPQA